MRIIESYLNEYKASDQSEKLSISKKMFKYTIGSCFKKMRRRVFDWRSIYRISSLTTFVETGFRPDFPFQTRANPDRRLSKLLRTVIEGAQQTLGEWLMTFHPIKDQTKLASSLTTFLTHASGPSDYLFNDIAPIFLDILLSSLYAYLCLMKQIHSCVTADPKSKEVSKYVGRFSNAIRILYYVTHSNAMKICFDYGRFPMFTFLSRANSVLTYNRVDGAISKVYEMQGWPEVPKDNEGGSTPEEVNPKEDQDCQEEEDSIEDGGQAIYRRSFMSFVDHFASLCLLERRCDRLPSGQSIELSLITVKHSESRYFPWEDMEKLILETCQDGSTTHSPVQGQDMIDKIKAHLGANSVGKNDKVIEN